MKSLQVMISGVIGTTVTVLFLLIAVSLDQSPLQTNLVPMLLGYFALAGIAGTIVLFIALKDDIMSIFDFF